MGVMTTGCVRGLVLWSACGSALAFSPSVSGPCGTPQLLEETLAAVVPQVPIRPPGTEKAERDANGVCANSASSDNFVLKWGNEATVSSLAVQDMLQAFEFSWSELVNDMGHPAPKTTESYKFNVYVGDTGSCAPSVYGMGGYFTVDSQGYPFIVMSLSLIHI